MPRAAFPGESRLLFATDLRMLIDAFGGAVIAALGAWVLARRLRTRATLVLGLFCTAFGLGQLIQNTISPTAPAPWPAIFLYGLELPLLFAAGVAALALPWALRAAGPRPAVPMAVLVASVAVATVACVVRDNPPLLPGGLAKSATGIGALYCGAVWTFLLLAIPGAVIALALEWPRADERRRRQSSLAMGALLLWPGYVAGSLSLADPHWAYGATFAFVIAGGSISLANSRRGHATHLARNVALLAFAILLSGMLAYVAWGAEGGYGAARIAMVFVLAYAILREQLLGLDVTVRWGIKKSAVAAIFLAAFFAAAQVAQNLFGEVYGPVLGGITAGLLLFAISPIQRAAERIANAAVPLQAAAPIPAAATTPRDLEIGLTQRERRESSYREAVRLALRDRPLSAHERVHLYRLADDLGIGAGRAAEIQHDVEREARG